MRKRSTLTHKRLTEVLTYRPRLGKFIWRMSTTNAIRVGEEAGTVQRDGRRIICIDGELYKAAVLAWFYVKGTWPHPDKMIDHEDNDRGNDRWKNLREVSPLQNAWNRRYKKDVVGITRRKNGKFRVRIGHKGSRKSLGDFNTHDEAVSAYRKTFRRLHGEVFG